jgi:hypothetical protein
MTERTAIILTFIVTLTFSGCALLTLSLFGASDELVAFAYVVLLCLTATALSHVTLRYQSNRRD